MKRARHWPLAAQAAAALLIVLAGCGTLPTAPGMERPAAPAASAPAVDHSELQGLPTPPVVPPVPADESESKTVQLVGSVETMVEVGRVKVTVPKDAIEGSAVIKVTVPDPSKLQCHLEISPANKNQFEKPVVLQFDASGARDVRTMAISWYDPTLEQWVEIPYTIDVDKKTVSADLSHFSEYQCFEELQTKAGW